MECVIIDGVEYVPKPTTVVPPTNDIGATHWAVLPDGSIQYYKIDQKLSIWIQSAILWQAGVTSIPYTLYSFDSYENLTNN